VDGQYKGINIIGQINDHKQKIVRPKIQKFIEHENNEQKQKIARDIILHRVNTPGAMEK
jgi:hypothetical protein